MFFKPDFYKKIGTDICSNKIIFEDDLVKKIHSSKKCTLCKNLLKLIYLF